MSPDFFAQLERQLVEAAERDAGASPRAHFRSGFGAGRRLVGALPVAAALACAALIAVVALSVGSDRAVDRAPNSARIPAAPLTAPAPRLNADVAVLNGTRRVSLATTAANTVRASGARVVTTGNAPVNTIAVSTVHADPGADGAGVARRLGIGGRVRPIDASLRAQAPGADVVVVLGADATRLSIPRLVALRGVGRAKGTATLVDTTTGQRLEIEAVGLPATSRNDYYVWAETPRGKLVPLGFAQFDAKRGRLAGTTDLEQFGGLRDPRRVYVTRSKTPGRVVPLPDAEQRGPIVLDSGPISALSALPAVKRLKPVAGTSPAGDPRRPAAGSPALPDQQINLRPVGADASGAMGVAVIAKGGLAIQANGLEPSDLYRVSLFTTEYDALPLGFANYNRKTKRLAGAINQLPPAASRYDYLVVTKQSGRGGDASGRVVLRGRVKRR